MMKSPFHIILFLICILLSDFLVSQNSVQDKQTKVAKHFVEAYNAQNYSKMKKNFFFVGRLLPIKKSLRSVFEPRFTKYGKATISRSRFPMDKKLVIELNYEKDVTEKDFLNFHFNKHNKIIGLSFYNPDFHYPKTINAISAQRLGPKIDSVVKPKSESGFNGSVLVIDNGNEIYKKSFGFANFETKELLNNNSAFELASCSKQFTGMAIMILAEQGKLNYSDIIQKYIPGLPYQNITIENLLTHTSGLPDYMEMMEKHWDKKKFATNYDIVDLFKKYKPKIYFSPNEKMEYSNTGYALLSIIIEKASGMTYAEFLTKTIFQPLGMENTRVYNTRRSKNEKINNYAYGYIYSDKLKKYILPDSLADYNYVIYMDAITGDGTVNTSISDLLIWDKALRENKLVSKNTIDKAFSAHKLKDGKESNYGFGQYVVNDDKNERLVYHGGSWPGYATFILHFIDKQITIAILSNNEYENTTKLANQIAKLLLETK
ncbi:MAG TPA: serine hydrolase domain-containing protein [Bacteroidia bacterium]|jgi:CubicO group peptidase (beta-lactamase class C family)|nr:serine hydrolase domain-containing protein [Bacteroidia bacterium]